jgi:signal transduction histidine kinase
MASEQLTMRARQVAETIADFLRDRESDLLFAARYAENPDLLLEFYRSRRSEVWSRTGTVTAPKESRELLPLYRSLSVVGSDGQERLAIRNGALAPRDQLRDVSDPARTEFPGETWFRDARKLKPGEIHVTRLTGFHVGKEEQLAGAPDPESAFTGRQYEGVIRFSTPLFDRSGAFDGLMVLSLDHRHLMEFSQHIDPGKGYATVYPSYQSGNYAFLFDDEGWIITHPKFWDIRGVNRQGKLVPPYTEQSSREEVAAGRIPFNLDFAGFIHANYPRVAELVRRHQIGTVDITNVGGARKIMAFAPIIYDTGDYRRHGIFGGVTIGFQVDQFHEAARAGGWLITDQLRGHLRRSSFIVALAALVAGLASWLLARGITRPLTQLTEGARRVAAGESTERVIVTTGDEVGDLADTFNLMANELELRKQSLLTTLTELRNSRREIMDERNFKESILESISSAILTFSPEGLLTSVNATGRTFLGNISAGTPCQAVFAGWGDLENRVKRVLAEGGGYGREPLHLDQGDGARYFDVGVFPIGPDAVQGITVTLRDETIREKLREEMTRLDRLVSLGKLSAGIAHEVRNPLTGISLLLDDLHDRAEFGAETQHLIKKALSEIERVEQMISALLKYASPVRTELRACDLNQVIHNSLLLVRRQCERQGTGLLFTPGDVPPCRLDPEKIKQALLNLVNNARESLQNGGSIEISTCSDGSSGTITVRDSGPGIAAADLPQIFEPFFTRKGAGTGLGLSITQRIVEEHHGRIEVESRSGEGACFTVTFPLRPYETRE